MKTSELEYHRGWRARNREKVHAAAARWREANPGWWRKYAGTEARRAQQAAHHQRTRAWKQARRRERYAANPAPFIEASRRHQALVARATVERVDYAAVIERDRGLCGICGQPVSATARSFDHIVPVARGGEHSMRNVQLAHLVCNKRKGAR